MIYLLAFLGFLVMSIIYVGPFVLVISGIIMFIEHYYWLGISLFVVGAILLWMIKPISIITGKKFDIF